MFLGTMQKQPGEKLPVDIDYSAVIAGRAADSIVLFEVRVPTGMQLESQDVSVPNKAAQLYIAGGSDGQVYSWTVVADITMGGRLTRVEDEFSVVVSEVSAASGAAPSYGAAF